jgi:formamidopyrimidine-DNA glycosylase
MPELPDIVAYIEALRPRVERQRIERVRVISPFVVRSVEPAIEAVAGMQVNAVRRLGKRIVFALDDELFLVLHLMIAGRLRWELPVRTPAAHSRPGRNLLASFEFDTGTLLLTEAGSKKRASLHVVAGQRTLAEHDPGGIEVLESDAETFIATLRRENHTLKRALTDPRLFSGIGNAYSDEILHAARLSPLAWTSRLTGEEARGLFAATRDTLTHWIAQLRRQFAGRFPGPGEITAFRDDFAVHGRFGKPCPVCGSPVQRIRYAENETNYCATCQTGGRVLADRSLSRILKDDWPRSIDELA